MNNKFKNVLAFGGFIVIVIIVSFFLPEETIQITEDSALSNNLEESNDVLEENKIYVYVVGAVHEPGIIVTKIGARIYEIIELCGGVTEDADLSKINLASLVKDEQKIVIPYKELTASGENTYIIMDNGLININTASAEKLEKLTGIGSSTARKIIKYREENGEFGSIEDIKNVSGIGDSKFDAIKDDITV